MVAKACRLAHDARDVGFLERLANEGHTVAIGLDTGYQDDVQSGPEPLGDLSQLKIRRDQAY